MSTARSIATAYDEYISACWRGERNGADLAGWLRTFWCPMHPAPTDSPSYARSPHAAGGRGITWFETETHVIGVVPGLNGCYAIPVDALVPSVNRFSMEAGPNGAHPAGWARLDAPELPVGTWSPRDVSVPVPVASRLEIASA